MLKVWYYFLFSLIYFMGFGFKGDLEFLFRFVLSCMERFQIKQLPLLAIPGSQ